jgi:hypothetical protein
MKNKIPFKLDFKIIEFHLLQLKIETSFNLLYANSIIQRNIMNKLFIYNFCNFICYKWHLYVTVITVYVLNILVTITRTTEYKINTVTKVKYSLRHVVFINFKSFSFIATLICQQVHGREKCVVVAK